MRSAIVVSIFLSLIMNNLAHAVCNIPIRLTPCIKARPLELPHYSMEVIRPFLKDSMVFCDKQAFVCHPRVIGIDHAQSAGGKFDHIFVRDIEDITERFYTIFRPGKTYYNPVSGEFLGFEADAIGVAELMVLDAISEFKILDAKEPVVVGMRLLPSYKLPPPQNLEVRPTPPCVGGLILSIKGGEGKERHAGPNQVVVISRGFREGLEVGNLLDIYQTNRKRTVCEPCPCPPKLPELKIGRLIVFRTYERVSLALIVEATEIINIHDQVRSPPDE